MRFRAAVLIGAGALALGAGCSVIVDSTLAGRDVDGAAADGGGPVGACGGQTPEGSLCVLDGGVGACHGGECRPTVCGDGVVEGIEACEPPAADGICRSDCTLACVADSDCPDDGNACTIERCDPTMGCVVDTTTNDVDGDGVYAMTCGGADCDDANPNVRPGLVETCDGVDNDCDPSNDTAPSFYPDCDGDGFAAPGATPMMGCSPPTGAPVSCGTAGSMAQWITRSPSRGSGDCSDADPRAFPGQRSYFDTAVVHSPTRLGDFDFDCSGTAETQWPISNPSRPVACDAPLRGGTTCATNPVYSSTSGSTTTPQCGDSAVTLECRYSAVSMTCVRPSSTSVERVACH